MSFILKTTTVLAAIVFFFILFFSNILDYNKMGQKIAKDTESKERVWKYYQLGKEKEYGGKKKKRSKGEEKCLKAAEKIFDTEFKTVRPSWLKNPKTGRNLEIDIYSDKLGIGIEYQGYQHTKYPNKFHKTKKQFLDQLERDKFKMNKCNELGVYLIIVYDDCKDIEDFIYKHAPKDCISKKYKC